MMNQLIASSLKLVARKICCIFSLPATSYKQQAAFTLIETLVAISLLSIAIVAPMSLVTQSLSSAYYARDQITAFNLAQEGIESVRGIRDNNVLQNAFYDSGTDLLTDIPIGQAFTIDARQVDPESAIAVCSTTPCPPLQTDGVLYGYDASWANTIFTRTLLASYVGASQDEIRLSVTVTWQTASHQPVPFTIYENMYRWVNDGTTI